MGILLDGKKVAGDILRELQQSIEQEKLHPELAIIIVGNNPASEAYVNIKKKKAAEVGIIVNVCQFPEDISEKELLTEIEKIQKKVQGVIVQLPLPRHINANDIIATIDPYKDVDGFTPTNVGKILLGKEDLVPATPKGIVRLLEAYNLSIEEKEVVIINRSNIVGKPLAVMLMNRGATVTVCHSKTHNLREHTQRADILVSAVGKANFITREMVKKNAIVVDVGIVKEGRIIKGDVDFLGVQQNAAYITPVPGGVGPMTVAMLLENVVLAQSFYKESGKIQ